MTRFERWSVWGTSLLVFVSGVGYMWTKYFVPAGDMGDMWAVVNHPLEPWFLRVHVLAAPAWVFAIGLITLRHVWRHIRTRTAGGRGSGMTLVWVLGPMVGTGYLLQVVTNLGWLRILALGHIGLGFLYMIGLGAHQWVLSRRRRAYDTWAGAGTEESPEHVAADAERDREAPLRPHAGREPFTARR